MHQHHNRQVDDIVLEAPKHDPLIKWPTWGHMTLSKIYISISARVIANKLGNLLILGRIFIMQSLKSSPTSCFSDCCKVSLMIPVFKNVWERSTARNYHPISLLSVVSKAFEKPVNNGIIDHLEKCDLFLISSGILGLVDQLQIFLQLYLKELLGHLTGLALIEL